MEHRIFLKYNNFSELKTSYPHQSRIETVLQSMFVHVAIVENPTASQPAATNTVAIVETPAASQFFSTSNSSILFFKICTL